MKGMIISSLKLSGILIIFAIIFSFQDHVLAEPDNTNLVNLIEPREDSLIVSKKPIIKCVITVPFSPENILVLLDGVDVTGIINITPDGFEYRPIGVIPPGAHSLSVTICTMDGREVLKEFTFSTRHSAWFEEAYSTNEVAAVYEAVLKKPKDVDNVPYSKIEANLSSDSKLKSKGWGFTFNTNARYIDQNLPLYPPQKKGLDLIDYLLIGKYEGEETRFAAEIGDVQINETPNTVQGLSRRGGRFSLGHKDLNLNVFAVKSEQIFGLEGGLGIGGSTDDHIMGVSGEVSLFSNRLNFKTIYVKGGEEGSSLGLWTTGGGNKGDVLGFVFNTEAFEQRLALEAELDFSEFDADTTDEFSPQHDKAYKLRANGNVGRYNLEALYEYMGPDYEAIGNQGLQKDREGFAILGGASFDIHSVNLSFSRYNDNVKKNELYPRVYTCQGTADYTFNKFVSLPMGLSYQKSILDSTMEPEFTLPLKIDTDSISGMINYMKGPWNLGLQANYSFQNDRTLEDNDTTTTTYTFTPTYFSEHFSVSPGFSFNRSISHLTDVETDTYTVNLDIRGDIFTRLTYEFAGTVNRIKADDDSIDQDTYNTYFRLACLLGERLWGFLRPSAAIRGEYNKSIDNVYDQENEELIVLFVFSTSMNFSF